MQGLRASYLEDLSTLCSGSSARYSAEQSWEIPSLYLHGVGPAAQQPGDLSQLQPVGLQLLPRRLRPCEPRHSGASHRDRERQYVGHWLGPSVCRLAGPVVGALYLKPR